MDHGNHALGIISGNASAAIGRARKGDQVVGAQSSNPADAAGMAMPGAVSIPDDHITCGECYGEPRAYLIECERECPRCKGAGHYADPDYCDPDDVFDPISEWGTYRAIGGMVA